MKNEYLETIKVLNGEIFNINYHQKRYESVLKSLGIKPFEQLIDYINPPKDGLYRCRLVYTPIKISVSYHKYEIRDIKSLKIVYDNNINYSKKSTNRKNIDSLFALKNKADDILIIKNSLVTDTSIANIAFYDSAKTDNKNEGVWLTPKKPLLKGTTRARLLDEGKIIEADIKVTDLSKFSKIALLNAMIDFYIVDKCEFLI